ncbi:MAG: hypothetical protein U5O39_15450 [Gammaproteobacteria bacterium]|nr:hypothetical protein [Gammaproteobacteria bacterium]
MLRATAGGGGFSVAGDGAPPFNFRTQTGFRQPLGVKPPTISTMERVAGAGARGANNNKEDRANLMGNRSSSL